MAVYLAVLDDEIISLVGLRQLKRLDPPDPNHIHICGVIREHPMFVVYKQESSTRQSEIYPPSESLGTHISSRRDVVFERIVAGENAEFFS